MTDADAVAPEPLDELRTDLDYDRLVASASPALRLYIRTLEQENARLRQELMELREAAARRRQVPASREEKETASLAQVITPQRPDNMMVVAITAGGACKRTPLNEYSAQRRGGMGVFDIQSDRDDPVAHLLVARADTASLLILTTRGRAFRVPVNTLPLTPIRARGNSLPGRLMLTGDEAISSVLAIDDERESRNTVLIATSNGWVRSLHRNYVGPRLQPGTLLVDPKRGGPPTAMALSAGDGDVVVALRSGLATRFREAQIRRDGVRGIQVRPDDAVVGIAPVSGDDAELMLVTADGQGTRRQMSGFSANKSPGAQGKVLMKTDALAAAAGAEEGDEVLCISGFAKIIRFAAAEVPAKSGAVQGVTVMDCRGDTLTTMTVVPQA